MPSGTSRNPPPSLQLGKPPSRHNSHSPLASISQDVDLGNNPASNTDLVKQAIEARKRRQMKMHLSSSTLLLRRPICLHGRVRGTEAEAQTREPQGPRRLSERSGTRYESRHDKLMWKRKPCISRSEACSETPCLGAQERG